MKRLLLYLHLSAAFFIFIGEYWQGAPGQSDFLLAMLLYLCSLFLPMLFSASVHLQTALFLFSFPALGFVATFVPAMALLFPLHIYRCLADCALPAVFEPSLPLVALPFLDKSLFVYYLALSVSALLVYRTLKKAEQHSDYQEAKLDKLETENRKLQLRLERLKMLEGEKEFSAVLEERNLIARKLHDELGHTLSGSMVQLEAVRTIFREDPLQAEKMLDRVCDVLGQGMHSIRTGLRGLKPAPAELGWQQIKKQLGDFELTSGIRGFGRLEGEAALLPASCWQVMQLNLREALTNILKHSGATEVFVTFTVLNKVIKVEIRDNGRGCPVLREGLGLSGMEERTREAGGTLIVDGSAGFSVIMLFRRRENGDSGIDRG